MYKLGLDIGGTKVNIGILDEDNSLLGTSKLYIKDIKDISSALKVAVEKLCDELSISFGEIGSCGVGVPGTVSEDNKRVLKAPNISLISEGLAASLENAFSVPIYLIQDSRAGALGEYLSGGAVGFKTAICFTLGTGIGTGIVIDERIYNGALGAAGELGHIPVVEGGRVCGCGRRGCLEKYSAGIGLSITASELFDEGSTSEMLFAKAKSGDSSAKKAIDEAVVLLGRGIVSAINLLSPDCVLFSGGLSSEELYLNPLIEYIKSHCYISEKLPVIKKADLGELSPMIGAALFPAYLN